MTHLIFTQNSVTGPAGQAFVGAVGLPVTVANDSGIPLIYYLVWAPKYNGSALTPSVVNLTQTAISGTPIGSGLTATFTPDVTDCYSVWATDMSGQNIVAKQDFVVARTIGSTTVHLPGLFSDRSTFNYNIANTVPGQSNGWATDIIAAVLATTASPTYFYVSNLAGLQALAGAGLTPMQTYHVVSLLDDFYWDPSSTSTQDGVTIIQLTDGTNPGRFIRRNLSATEWKLVATWYIDGTSGNDENAGTSGAPIKTCGEWFRRTAGQAYNSVTTLNLVTVPADTNALADFPVYNMSNSSNGSLNVIATPTVLTSGTLTTGFSTFSGNTRPTMGDSSRSTGFWTTYVGKWILITSGTASGTAYLIDADAGSGNVYVTTGFAVNGGTGDPSSGATYQIVDAMSYNALFYPENAYYSVNYKWIAYTSSTGEKNWYARCYFYGCRLPHSDQSFTQAGFFYSCHFPNQFISQLSYGTLEFFNCLFNGGLLAAGGAAQVLAQSCIFDGGNVQCSFASAYLQGASVSVVDCGFFNYGSTAALAASKAGTVFIEGTFYGSGYGSLRLRGASKAVIASSVTWNLVGSTLDIDLVNGPNQIPYPTAGSALPSASACSTYAQWAASPFSKAMFPTSDGCNIVVG
jgi:hypothetical protein